MRILITAGPTHEPIDPVRFIGNRSSGKMGVALASAGFQVGHSTTLILGPTEISVPPTVRRLDFETTAQLQDLVNKEFPAHDLLIMAAAVADYRPKVAANLKLPRKVNFVLELESTPDILAEIGKSKRADQRTVGFSLGGDESIARSKLAAKKLDLIVFNPVTTIGKDLIDPTLIFANGNAQKLPSLSKTDFADILIQRCAALFAK